MTTNTRVGAVLQNNVGIANSNEANIGSVVGSSVGGDVSTNTRVGAVLQNNVGIANSNEASIGSID